MHIADRGSRPTAKFKPSLYDEDGVEEVEMKKQIELVFTLVLAFTALSASAQIATGGAYALEQSVIANGGGNSAAGNYAVDGSDGQSAAGTNGSGGAYSLRGGFWNPLPGPTAANVTISGRVIRDDGLGIRNVRVTITGNSLTSPRTALTSSFGHFTFDDIEAGQSYVISVTSKRYGFAQPSRIISVTDSIGDLLFTSTWQN